MLIFAFDRSPFRYTGAAIQILTEGGVTLNGNKIVDGMSASTFGEKDLLDGRLAVLRVGKTGNLVVVVDEE